MYIAMMLTSPGLKKVKSVKLISAMKGISLVDRMIVHVKIDGEA
jgi:hypothetical protein